jgi:hypothetical protein
MQLVHKLLQCKNRAINYGGNYGNSSGGFFCNVARQALQEELIQVEEEGSTK